MCCPGAHVGDSRASSAAETTLDPVFPWLRLRGRWAGRRKLHTLGVAEVARALLKPAHLVDAYAATWASLGIDGALLSDDDLTEADLEELSVAISIHRRRVLAAVARLKSQGVPEELLAPTPPATPEPASPPRRAAPKKSPARSPARSAPSPPPPKKRAADGRPTARELHATAGRRASAAPAPEPPQPKRRAFTDLGVNGRDAEIEAAKRRAAARKSGAKPAPRPAPRKPAAIPARPKEPAAPDDGFFDDGDFEAPTGDEDVADLFG